MLQPLSGLIGDNAVARFGTRRKGEMRDERVHGLHNRQTTGASRALTTAQEQPLKEREEYGVGTVGRWALRWPAPSPTCDELTPADYAMYYFWYIIDGDRRMVK